MTLTAHRREFLTGAGALILGFDIAAMAQQGAPDLPGDLKIAPKVSSWLRIEAGGKVRLLVGKVEIGQGILTACGQLCADELAIDMKRLEITSGDTRVVPNEGVTAGSFSMPNCGTAVRAVAADARRILLDLAAQKLGAPAAGLKVEDGKVSAPVTFAGMSSRTTLLPM
jgi:CO/xanthine dehydrogenase Mo-binding subunit